MESKHNDLEKQLVLLEYLLDVFTEHNTKREFGKDSSIRIFEPKFTPNGVVFSYKIRLTTLLSYLVNSLKDIDLKRYDYRQNMIDSFAKIRELLPRYDFIERATGRYIESRTPETRNQYEDDLIEISKSSSVSVQYMDKNAVNNKYFIRHFLNQVREKINPRFIKTGISTEMNLNEYHTYTLTDDSKFKISHYFDSLSSYPPRTDYDCVFVMGDEYLKPSIDDI